MGIFCAVYANPWATTARFFVAIPYQNDWLVCEHRQEGALKRTPTRLRRGFNSARRRVGVRFSAPSWHERSNVPVPVCQFPIQNRPSSSYNFLGRMSDEAGGMVSV